MHTIPIEAACIGEHPKSDFVKFPDWFNVPTGPDTNVNLGIVTIAESRVGEIEEIVTAS